MPTLTNADVMSLLAAGIAKATEISEPSCVCVVDAGGHIAGFARSDEALFGCAEIALTKAYTAAAFRMPNGELQPDAQPGGEIHAVETAGRGRNFTAIAGGYPLFRDGACIGAVGVSGGPVAHDVIIGTAMAEAFEG